MTVASQLDRDAFVWTLARFHDLGLLTSAETDEVLALFDPDFPYADAVAAAESIHSNNDERLFALRPWLIDYNFQRPHSAISNRPPASRLPSTT